MSNVLAFLLCSSKRKEKGGKKVYWMYSKPMSLFAVIDSLSTHKSETVPFI